VASQRHRSQRVAGAGRANYEYWEPSCDASDRLQTIESPAGVAAKETACMLYGLLLDLPPFNGRNAVVILMVQGGIS
jgi:hypothetical protein